MKYRKKPVIIDAWQSYKDAGTYTCEWPQWVLDACIDGTIFDKDREVYIKTLEGDMHVSDGDYIIKGVQDELYPCKPDIFEATYEKVES